jgi:hypothetical protein
MTSTTAPADAFFAPVDGTRVRGDTVQVMTFAPGDIATTPGGGSSTVQRTAPNLGTSVPTPPADSPTSSPKP